MPTYEVRIYETLMHTITVQASSREDAYDQAYDICMNGPDNQYESESCGTSDEHDIMEVK